MSGRIVLCDPVGVVNPSAKRAVALNWTPGKRIATLFNNHVSSYRVWMRLQALLGEHAGADRLQAYVKENTFAEAPPEMTRALVKDADLAIVGVAA